MKIIKNNLEGGTTIYTSLGTSSVYGRFFLPTELTGSNINVLENYININKSELVYVIQTQEGVEMRAYLPENQEEYLMIIKNKVILLIKAYNRNQIQKQLLE